MKQFKSLLFITIFAFVVTSCDDDNGPVDQPTKATKVENLHAPADGRGNYTGEFTKFSFSEGKQVTGDNWDIAFRATEIIVNGGEKGKLLEDIDRKSDVSATIVSEVFSDVKKVPEEAVFKQDTPEALSIPKGSNNGWYKYNFETHLITPIPGKTLVVKTHNGHYAKMEILSYYKDGETSKSSQYYTFNYIYNPIKGDKELQ